MFFQAICCHEDSTSCEMFEGRRLRFSASEKCKRRDKTRFTHGKEKNVHIIRGNIVVLMLLHRVAFFWGSVGLIMAEPLRKPMQSVGLMSGE